MKIVITGGAGFIGSNIANALAEEHEVIAVDDTSLGVPENLHGVPLVEKSVLDSSFKEVCSGADVIVHLASASSAPMFSNLIPSMTSNVEGTTNVLDVAREMGAKVLYASTSSLYSKFDPPHKEDMPVRPGSFYELSKYFNEQTARLFHELYGVESVGMRFFSVYGENERHKGEYANIVSQFLWKMRDGEAPVIYGDGTQTRDFIYVGDVVEFVKLAIKKAKGCDVYNVGTGTAHSFNDVVDLLNEALGTDIEPTYVDNPIANYVKHTLADVSKSRSELGFKAGITLSDGIKKLVELQREG
ncbi:MAG: NAD-dependent epimerase/dehydratase family protein [Methermicoccaceae archaeon]